MTLDPRTPLHPVTLDKEPRRLKRWRPLLLGSVLGLLLVLYGPDLWAQDAGKAVSKPGRLALWAVVELHFLGIMVLTGSTLLAFLIDGLGVVLGQSFAIGDGLWKGLFSRLSVMFSLLGLAALGVAGTYPEAAQHWLGLCAPTFLVHVYFGALGLASGYGVLSCHHLSGDGRKRDRAQSAILAVVGLLILGCYRIAIEGKGDAAQLFGILAFAGPALTLAWCHWTNRVEGTRLTFEAVAALSFMVLLGNAESWRGLEEVHASVGDVFARLRLRRSVFHGVASIALVSLMELAWGRASQSGGALGREVRRLGGDDRWFVVTAVLCLTSLPFMGYLGSVVAAPGSWLLVFQGGLAGVTLLSLSHILWTRLERTDGVGVDRVWLWASAFLAGFLILITPSDVPLSSSELVALGGQGNHPGLAFWGSAACKHVAFGGICLASFDAAICVLRTEIIRPPLNLLQQARVQAAVWLIGVASVVFVVAGFGVVRGQGSLGSGWDLLQIVLLDTDSKTPLALADESRPEVLRALSVKSVPRRPALLVQKKYVERSRFGTVPAVREGWSLRDRGAPVADWRKLLTRRALSLHAWELLWLEDQFSELEGPRRRWVGLHMSRLSRALQAEGDERRLRRHYKLERAQQDLLWVPCLILFGGIFVLTLGCWLLSNNKWEQGRLVELGYVAASLVLFFVWGKALGDEAPLVHRLYGAQQTLLLAVLMHLLFSELALLALSPSLEVLEEAKELAEWGSAASWYRRQRVEIVAALSFGFLLVLVGWAQSEIGLEAMSEVSEGAGFSVILRSAQGYPLGTAVKSSFVLSCMLTVFLGATRFFAWTQSVGDDTVVAETETNWLLLMPLVVLLTLLAMYLVSESRVVAFLFLILASLAFLSRRRWLDLPYLAIFAAFLYLFLGIESAGLEEVRRRPLLRERRVVVKSSADTTAARKAARKAAKEAAQEAKKASEKESSGASKSGSSKAGSSGANKSGGSR